MSDNIILVAAALGTFFLLKFLEVMVTRWCAKREASRPDMPSALQADRTYAAFQVAKGETQVENVARILKSLGEGSLDQERASRAHRYASMPAQQSAWYLFHHLWSHREEPYVKDEWVRLEKAISDLGARPS